MRYLNIMHHSQPLEFEISGNTVRTRNARPTEGFIIWERTHGGSQQTPNQLSGHFIGIACGVGSLSSAERSYKLALTQISSTLSDELPQQKNALSELPRSESYINSQIVARCLQGLQAAWRRSPSAENLAVVLTLAQLCGSHARVQHVGNNRAYHFHHGHLIQLTADHTVASRLVDAGLISGKRARMSHLRRIVWNALGTHVDSIELQCTEVPLQAGDCILLCSQGLASTISDSELRSACLSYHSAKGICEAIMSRSIQSQTSGNGTIVVARAIAASTSTSIEKSVEDEA